MPATNQEVNCWHSLLKVKNFAPDQMFGSFQGMGRVSMLTLT